MLPDDYRQWAAEHRPDLHDRLTAIAEGFRDFHLSRATRSASWCAEWRRWISRERAPKPAQNRPTTPPSDSRYPKSDARKDPVAAAQKAEQERAYRAKHDAWLFEQAALTRQRQAAAAAAASTPSDHPQSPPDNDSTRDRTPQQPTPTTKRPLGRLAGLVKEVLSLTDTQRPLERGDDA